MKNRKIRFDTAELLRLIYDRCGLARFAGAMQISEERLVRLLFGLEEFSQDEMLLAAKLLYLSDEEFLRCFFTPVGSENLNNNNEKGERT